MATIKTKAFSVTEKIRAWERVGGYDYFAKQAFHREAKRALKALAGLLDLPVGSYDLRSNLAGDAVTGEVTLHADHLYIQVSGGWRGREVLFRTCENREDYTGGKNHQVPAAALDTPEVLAVQVRALFTPMFSLAS